MWQTNARITTKCSGHALRAREFLRWGFKRWHRMDGHYWMTRVSAGVEQGDSLSAQLGWWAFELSRRIWGEWRIEKRGRCIPFSRKLQRVMLIIILHLPFPVFRHWHSSMKAPSFFLLVHVQRSREVPKERGRWRPAWGAQEGVLISQNSGRTGKLPRGKGGPLFVLPKWVGQHMADGKAWAH